MVGAFNPTPANIAGVAATSVWPAATTYALAQYPPARDFTQAYAYCGYKACGPQTLGYGDPRWKAGNGSFINVFGLTKYDCKRGVSLQTRAGLDPAGVVDLFFGSPLKTAGTLGISFASFRAILYYNLQYILAAHISNNVPRDATVVEFGCGTGLTFNYYGNSTQLIYAVDKKADPGLLGTVGAQAGKTVSAQRVETYAERLSFATGAADAVLSVDALGLEDDIAGAVAEASRVLKPGGPLLFFEQGRAPGALTEELRKCGEFSSVRFDDRWGSYPLAPHAIGIAIRNDAPPRADDASRAAGDKRSTKAFAKPKEAAPTGKGFGGAAKKPAA